MRAKRQDVRVRVGRKLRQLRFLRSFSQETLAERSGVGHKHIGKIELGKVSATIDVLANLASALDVDIIALLEPPPSGAKEQAVYTLTHRELDSVQRALDVIARAKQRRVPRQSSKNR